MNAAVGDRDQGPMRVLDLTAKRADGGLLVTLAVARRDPSRRFGSLEVEVGDVPDDVVAYLRTWLGPDPALLEALNAAGRRVDELENAPQSAPPELVDVGKLRAALREYRSAMRSLRSSDATADVVRGAIAAGDALAADVMNASRVAL